jgi:hypothetical protein
MTKLYELKRGDKFVIIDPQAEGAPFSMKVGLGGILTLNHIDGMYSLCRDHLGAICHPAAWTEVELYQDEP